MNIGPLSTPIAVIVKNPTGIDFSQATITALLAVVSGFILYVIKSYIDETWLRKRRDYKKLKAEIAYTLIMYSRVYMNPQVKPTELSDEASTALRQCAARMGSFIEEWPHNIRGIPKRKELKEASSEMFGLSNRICVCETEDLFETIDVNEKALNKIKTILALKE